MIPFLHEFLYKNLFKIAILSFLLVHIVSASEIHSEKFSIYPDKTGLKYPHNSDEKNLYFVFTLFRHGAREPLEKFLTNSSLDIFGNKWDHPGELNKEGIKYNYEIGKKYKERYRNFINNQFIAKEIAIYSTNFNRTIMSVLSQMKSFYSEVHYDNMKNFDISNDEKIDSKLNVILPPVQTIERKPNYKKFLFSQPKLIYEGILNFNYYCPSIKKAIKDNMEKEIKNW